MKKIFLSALMAITCLAVSAQQEEGTFSIKPEIGMTMGMYSKIDNSKPRYAGLIGLEGMYQCTGRFAVSAGLRYAQYGGMQKDDSDKITYKMDYVTVPILANVYVVNGLAVKAGVEMGFNVRAKLRSSLSGTTKEDQKYVYELSKARDASGDIDCKDYAKKFTLAIPVGLSYEISDFVLDARYNIGVTKAFKDVDPIQNSFVFTVGYKIDND